jgi:hypothetical protein
LKGTKYSPSLSGNRRIVEKLYESSDVITGNAGLGFSSPQRVKFVSLTPSLSMTLRTTYVDFEREAYQQYTTVGGVVTDSTFVSALDSVQTESEFTWRTGVSPIPTSTAPSIRGSGRCARCVTP